VSVYDPLVEGERLTAIGLEAIGDPFAEAQPRYDIVILCFPHQQFVAKPLSDYIGLLDAGTGVEVWVDLKGIFANAVRGEPGIVCGTL
jgi:UDP-N-acetyl-D-mannosaminuronate dehydrogenase